MKTEYPPDQWLKVEDYAKALNARNTMLSVIFGNLNDVLVRIIHDTQEMEEPSKASRQHPILVLYAHEIAHRIGGYLNVPHDNSRSFCEQRLHALEKARDMYAVRDRGFYSIKRAGETVAHIATNCQTMFAEVDRIEKEFGGEISNFNKETGVFYV